MIWKNWHKINLKNLDKTEVITWLSENHAVGLTVGGVCADYFLKGKILYIKTDELVMKFKLTF